MTLSANLIDVLEASEADLSGNVCSNELLPTWSFGLFETM